VTLATVLTRAQFALEAPLVRVEVHCGAGLPQLTVVGLAETSVRESRERVRAALAHGGFEFPAGRVTVNLAPADLPKEGGRFDLPIAIGILVASAQLPPGPFDATELYGELSLSGEMLSIRGALPTAQSQYLPSFVFGLVILVLLVRPEGLFTRGGRTVERV